MHIIFRILVILVVASLVAGGLYLALNNNSASGVTSGGFDRQSAASFGGERLGSEGRNQGNLAGGISTLLETLFKIATIVAGVVLAQEIVGALGSGRRSPRPKQA